MDGAVARRLGQLSMVAVVIVIGLVATGIATFYLGLGAPALFGLLGLITLGLMSRRPALLAGFCLAADAWPAAYVNAQRCLTPPAPSSDRRPAADCQPQVCDHEACGSCPQATSFRPIEAWCLKPPGIGPTQCAIH